SGSWRARRRSGARRPDDGPRDSSNTETRSLRMAEWRVERRGAVEVWTILGEARRNTLTRSLIEELEGHVARVRTNRAVRAVVITGEGGKAFCAGADLKDREKMSDDDVKAWLDLLHRVFRE